MRSTATFAIGCSALVLSLLPQARAQTYKAIGEYKLPAGAARGIAVDTEGRRLFVADGDGIVVLDADSGATVGMIAGLKNAQDVLLVPEKKGEEKAASVQGFASDAAGHVIAFSLGDLKATATLKLETSGPSSLCYDEESKTIEAVSAGGSLTNINAATAKVERATRISTGNGQTACGTLSHVYVADTAANVIHVLNHETMKNDGDFPIMKGRGPTGVSLDTKGRRLFVSCEDGTIEIIDTDSGFTFSELKSGSGPAREAFTFLPQGKGQWKAASFVAQQDGTLTAIRMNAFINYSLGGVYKIKPGLQSIAYDDKTHHLFVTSSDATSSSVLVVAY